MTTQSMQLESGVPELVALGKDTIATIMASFIDLTKPNMTNELFEHVLNTLTCDKYLADADRKCGFASKPGASGAWSLQGGSMALSDKEVADGIKGIAGFGLQDTNGHFDEVRKKMAQMGLF